MAEYNIYQKLAFLQAGLKCPKGQYNSFGKYSYRSCEDILEAVKPAMLSQKTELLISDDLKLIGDRYYIEATVTLYDLESGEKITAKGFARESESKAGMDACQITGCASSYARKYALNALFLIDDTKDADTDEYHTQTSQKSPASGSRVKPVQKPTAPKKEPANQFVCADCGKPFQPLVYNGETWTPEMQWKKAKTLSPDGVARCSECRKKDK